MHILLQVHPSEHSLLQLSLPLSPSLSLSRSDAYSKGNAVHKNGSDTSKQVPYIDQRCLHSYAASFFNVAGHAPQIKHDD